MRLARNATWLVAGALLVVSPAGVRAQRGPGLHVAAAIGPTLPTGKNTSQLSTGIHVQVSLEVRKHDALTALRFEALFDQFGYEDLLYYPQQPCNLPGCVPVTASAHDRVLGWTGDLVLRPLRPGPAVAPYLIGGAGLYHFTDSGSTISRNEIGLNAGAGIEVPRLHGFLEVREHVVKNAPNYVPIAVGVRF